MKVRTESGSIVELRDVREVNGQLFRALNDIINGAVVATRQSTRLGDGTSYTFRLLRPTAPDGGLLLVTFHCPGQADYTDVRNAERELGFIARYPAECWAALEAFQRTQHDAITDGRSV